jgi:hypothetical protein
VRYFRYAYFKTATTSEVVAVFSFTFHVEFDTLKCSEARSMQQSIAPTEYFSSDVAEDILLAMPQILDILLIDRTSSH